MDLDEPIVWTGDLNDDCSALWKGLLLIAEWLDEDYRYWGVYHADGQGGEIDASYNHITPIIGGEAARQNAERAARKYIQSRGKQ